MYNYDTNQQQVHDITKLNAGYDLFFTKGLFACIWFCILSRF
jgi:hypothetical protein